MRYRQWKKNYKKRYGVNPPATIDKRKQRKLAKRTVKSIAAIDWDAIRKRTIGAAQVFTDTLANFMRALGGGFDAAGTVCRNAADNLQELEIRGCVLSWEVKPVVGDYGVYENNALDGSSELKLITNSRAAAEKIAEIMQQDQLQHFRLNYPERVQKKQRCDIADAIADGMRAQYCLFDEGVIDAD